MKKEYEFFHNLLISWWQGTKTKNEIIEVVSPVFEIKSISEWSDFINDFEESIREYDEQYYFVWAEYKEYAKDTAATVLGLLHCIESYQSKELTTEEFINWACWHNTDCGETTRGVFENRSIEYFCLFFLPKYYENLDSIFYTKACGLIIASNKLQYGEFVIALNLLLEKEKKSMFYFLKSYLEGKKTDADLNDYLIKKFSINLPAFKFDLSVFPYSEELKQIKENGDGVESLISLMEK